MSGVENIGCEGCYGASCSGDEMSGGEMSGGENVRGRNSHKVSMPWGEMSKISWWRRMSWGEMLRGRNVTSGCAKCHI